MFVSCGRKDDTVCVILGIYNRAQEDIYVETNFPPSFSSKNESSQEILHFHSGVCLFEGSMHRIRTYDDLASQLLDRYPEAMIWIYSVNGDNEKGELLLSCPLVEYPATTDYEDFWNMLHIRPLHPNDYPNEISFTAVWKDNQLKGSIN